MSRRSAPWPAAEGGQTGPVDPTPGAVVPPQGVLPGWNWLPDDGLHRDAHQPWWLEVWLATPLLTRYAHVWMWHHGRYSFVADPCPDDGGDASGDREPRVPPAPAPPLQAACLLSSSSARLPS